MADARVLCAQPWRFLPGDHCYVYGWAADAQVVVTRQLIFRSAPHYYVVDPDGAEWRVPQLHLSRSPISAE
jgi:hypothetical protein